MGFKLIHEDEQLSVKNLIAILFGEPGVGKSSLGFTTKSPCMLDFDKGLERVVNRKLSVKLYNWNDALEFMESSVIKDHNVETLIVDTAGTMLDNYLSSHVLSMDEKFGNGSGSLGMKGYGVMKDAASKFFNAAEKLNVDVIFICHTGQERDGDIIRLQPKMTGGAYDILVAKADLIGYMEMKNNRITIDFNPTTKHTGKNCAQLPPMIVPDFKEPEYATFMGDIIDQTKKHMVRANAAQMKAVMLVDEFKSKIDSIESLEDLESLYEGIKSLSPIYKAQVNQAYERKFLKLWQPVFMNPEKLKTAEDFDALTSVVRDLSDTLQLEIRPVFKKLVDDAGLIYDRDKKSYHVKGKETKSQTSVPQETKAPAGKVLHDEKWFTSKIGKKIKAVSKSFKGPMTINDEAHALHLCNVSQVTGGYEFSEND